MAGTSYYEKLKDPRWQRKRLEVLELNCWACEDCGETEKTLHVHHGYYEPKCDPWDYTSATLHVLCEDCHERVTIQMLDLNRSIGSLNVATIEQLRGYVVGLALQDCPVGAVEVESHEFACGIGDAWGVSAEEVIDIHRDSGVDGFTLQAYTIAKRGGQSA